MVDRSDSIVIDRPVEDVFAYVADVTNDPSWHTDILEARKTTDGPVGMGAVWHTRFKPAMGISEADIEVVSFEPNRVLAMKGEVGPMHPTLTYRFEPADGGTKFTRRVQINVSGLMKIMQPMIGMMKPLNS